MQSTLSEEEVMQHQLRLVTHGYTVIPAAVGPHYVRSALQIINREMGKLVKGEGGGSGGDGGGSSPDASDTAKRINNGQQLPHIANCPAFQQLYTTSGLSKVISDIVGRPLKPNGWGQVACRFPSESCLPVPEIIDKQECYPYLPSPWWCNGWHIDGLPGATHKNHPKGIIGHFAALVGVCLEDALEPMMGNFIVYPNSHHTIHKFVNSNDGANLAALEQEGMGAMPKDLPFSPPIQIKLKAGDVVMAHYQLAHSIAPNANERIRYQIYYRVQTADTPPPSQAPPQPYRREPMRYLWEDFGDSVKAIAMSLPPYEPSAADVAVASMKGSAEGLYSSQKYDVAAPMFEALANHHPHNYDFAMKAGCAYTFASSQMLASGNVRALPEVAQFAQKGEHFLCRAMAMYGGNMGPHSFLYCILARSLATQGRHAEAFDVIRQKVLASPHMLKTPMQHWYKLEEAQWQKDLVLRTARLLYDCMLKTGRSQEEVREMQKTFAKQFPSVSGVSTPMHLLGGPNGRGGGGGDGCTIA